MAKYKLTKNGVQDTEHNLSIPEAPGNRHWQEYQAWLAEGNTPDDADPMPEPTATRIIDGEKISDETKAELSSAETVDELKIALSEILMGRS